MTNDDNNADQLNVLAESYIPRNLRAINEAGDPFLLWTPPPTQNESHMLAKIRTELIPFGQLLPEDDEILAQRCPVQTVNLQDEHDFAIHQRLSRESSGKEHSNSDGLPVPSVESIDNLEDYCNTFRKLVQVERNHLLLLYERYSQYDCEVNIHDVQNGYGAVQHNILSANIKGIADASPPIQIGDFMSIRSLRLFLLPAEPSLLPHHNIHGSSPPVNTPPVAWRYVEVRSMITSVQRTPGTIQALWLDAPWSNWLQHLYPSSSFSNGRPTDPKTSSVGKDSKNDSSKDGPPTCPFQFNLRFHPSIKHHVACLSALKWLSNQSSPHVMPLLFPTSEPILPRNEKLDPTIGSSSPLQDAATTATTEGTNALNLSQMDFCRILMKRTQQPEYLQTRGPLILTGPAGTGKSFCFVLERRTISRMTQSCQI